MRQGQLLDFKEGTRRAEDGMARAVDGAGVDWAWAAAWTVLTIARAKETFTSDDVWVALKKPREPRALGAVMNRLARRGEIEPTGRYIKTSQASRNNAPVREWRQKP